MKVLIADDSGITRHLLGSCLRSWEYQCVEATNGLDALAALSAADSPRLAILDWHMPGLDGLRVCQSLRAKATDENYCYVIMLTGKTDRDSLLQALEAGVDDFLTKPFDAAELKQRLLAGRRILALQDRIVTAHEALRLQATQDQLTGCWNRGAILDILEQELDLAARESRSVGVILLDIDRFKQINDEHGHQAGDEVLRQVVDRLQAELCSHASIGRYGGEEFLITIPDADEAVVTNLGERLRACLCDKPMHVQGNELTATMSLGATTTDAQGDFNAGELIGAADLALYAAKRNGRNSLHIHLGDHLPMLPGSPSLAPQESAAGTL